MEFGQFVKERRRALDLTQAALAERSSCSVDTIKSIESRGVRPSRDLAAVLAAALEIPPAERAAFVQWARIPPPAPPSRDAGGLRPGPAPSTGAAFISPASLLPAVSPPIRPTGPRTNLCFFPTPLVGRGPEIATVRQLLWNAGVRLVTLTGPPGTGKTRLAIQAATGLLDDCADGVWFVSLAPIREPGLVASTIAGVLGVKELGGQPLAETLAAYLRDKNMLLVLDNFEQVLDAGSVISALLASTARLKVLITSREVLHLYGEHEFAVPPLPVPDVVALRDPTRLAGYDAVELFRQRAVAVSSGFALTAETGPPVGEICRRLDGLPLAIELAAARVRLLSPATILTRLDNRLKLLAGGPRDVPPRQQTLRAAIEWSYDLLGEAERRLFRRLGVFTGGATGEAIQAICNPLSDLGMDGLDGVAALVEGNLLRPAEDRDGTPRYVMLETIRQYAWERLAHSGESGAIRQRHLDYFMALAEEAEPQWMTGQQAEWLRRLTDEHDNLRAALHWATNVGSAQGLGQALSKAVRNAGAGEGDDTEQAKTVESGLRLAGALYRFWQMSGYLSEGRAHLADVLALGGLGAVSTSTSAGSGMDMSGTPTARMRTARAKALNAAADLAWNQGDYATSSLLHKASLALWRELGDQTGIAWSLNSLGLVAVDQRDYASARLLFEEALAIRRELSDKWGIAISLIGLGLVAANFGDYAGARTLYEESLAIQQALGDRWGSAISLLDLGVLAFRQGDYAGARALYDEALTTFREVGDKVILATTLARLGQVAHHEGDAVQAREFYAHSLLIRRELGHRPMLALSLLSLAGVAATSRQPQRGARLLGAAKALFESGGAAVDMANRAEYDRCLAIVQAQLDEAAFVTACAAGQAMTLEQAVAYALGEES
jgi:predicted ATPase/DNA-binding XRE family transcriptional regulator